MPSLEDARDLVTMAATDLAAADMLYVYDESTSTPKTLSYAQLQESINVPSHGKTLVMTGDLRGAYAVSPFVKLLDLSRSGVAYPHGITITSWYMDCVNSADPVKEINANLSYCTAPTNSQTFATAAEAGGGAVVVVDVLDTTTGNSSRTDMSLSTATTGNVPANKVLFLDMDADPEDMNITWSLTINFTTNIA